MLLFDHGLFRPAFNTLSKVAPDIYRSSQPLPYQIRKAARRGVRTVINLRGEHRNSSYKLEAEACTRSGLALINFRLRSRDVPSTQEVEDFAALLANVEYPILLHCKSGADRAGLASAIALILRYEVTPARALRQLSLRYWHVRQAKTGILDFFLEHYREFDARQPIDLLAWAREHYDPARMRRAFRAQWWASFITDRLLHRE